MTTTSNPTSVTAPNTPPPSSGTVPALRVDGVTKRFGDVVAVDGVSFEVAAAELVALVGPSGCGKSTLLRMIAGLIPTESGTVDLAGVVVDDGHVSFPPEQRHVGLVFQEHALFPHLSVERNVGFGVRTSAAERTVRVAELLELVGLLGYGDRYPHELSGGERQRVALARALAPGPSLMLLDEPFASLDPNLRAQIRNDIVRILRSTGTPAVFVTHDQSEALAIGDRIAVMNAGHLVQLDTPEVLFHEPIDRFVAAFMGEADFLGADDVVAGLHRSVADVVVGELSAGGVIMTRPDDVDFVAVPDGTAIITAAEFRGSSWCYTLRLATGAEIRSNRQHIDRVDVGTAVTPRVVAGHHLVVVDGDVSGADGAYHRPNGR